jgi:opacity protein-like surface antigen
MRRLLSAVALALALLTAANAAHATEPVDLILVLAVDSSGSVDSERFALQRKGYAAALTNPEVLGSIRSGRNGAIGLIYFEWSGPQLHSDLVGWTRIDSEVSAGQVASALLSAPRTIFGGGTSISGAIDHSRALLQTSPFAAPRRVVDISGDGRNNRGRGLAAARAEALADGLIINGLPILGVEYGLDRYYEDEVIGGPGSFIVAAEGFEDFGRAILKKLLRDLVSEAR